MTEKFITSAKNFKLLEREAIKEALEADVFGDIDDDPNLYLPHPELGSKKKLFEPVFADEDEVSMDDEDFFKEVGAGKAETAGLWENNKKKSIKGKEKVVETVPSKRIGASDRGSASEVAFPEEERRPPPVHVESGDRIRRGRNECEADVDGIKLSCHCLDGMADFARTPA
ncbi:hypothetical protein R1sor_027591 [Riccia sorocarpa]|uniref:Uncharacterized protein n=1 Tax=Riccia sorocarpa TaxID=122646 RepID=A0ABD3GEN9_9MARC